MAQQISMTNSETGLTKLIPIGFSWTTLFFGFFVPLIRGDIRWGGLMFVSGLVALVGGAVVIALVGAETDAPGAVLILALAGPLVINVVFAMRYNTMCATALVESGFKPTDADGRRLLAAQGIRVREPARGDVVPDGSGQLQRSDPGVGVHDGDGDPVASASDPAHSSAATRRVGGIRDSTRKVVAVVGSVVCAMAALVLPVANVPLIGAVSWSFPPGGEVGDGVLIAGAAVLAAVLGLSGKARGWNSIPATAVLAIATAGLYRFTLAIRDAQADAAASDLGILQGVAEMALESITLGPAAPVALLGGVTILASAVAARCREADYSGRAGVFLKLG